MEPFLLHPELDRGDRIGKTDRMVPLLVRLDDDPVLLTVHEPDSVAMD